MKLKRPEIPFKSIRGNVTSQGFISLTGWWDIEISGIQDSSFGFQRVNEMLQDILNQYYWH